jgi:hypothetical protein
MFIVTCRIKRLRRKRNAQRCVSALPRLRRSAARTTQQRHVPVGGERGERGVRARGRGGGGFGGHVSEEGGALRAPRREEGRVEETHAGVQAVAPPRAVVQAACTRSSGKQRERELHSCVC